MADKVIFVVLVASCFMIPVIGQRVLPVELSNIINNLINYRLKLAGDTFSKFAPSLFDAMISFMAGTFLVRE